MKIAFFWTWEFSANILAWILTYNSPPARGEMAESQRGVEVLLTVSQPDKPFWRKQELMPTKVKEFSLSKWLNILQPEKLKNNQEFLDHLKSLDLDFIVVVAYGKIIPTSILEIPKYWCINIHWSILPSYRWASPIQESIKNWDKKTGLTIMYMSAWMDEWDILAIEEVEIGILDKTPEIFKKFENIWVDLLINTLNWVIDWKIKWQKQDDSKATYCKKIEKEMWKIDFEKENLLQIYNKFKAFYPWPWVFTNYEWKKFQITDLYFEENDLFFDEDFNLWDVVEFEDHGQNNIWILCKWWILILKKVKLEWKKEMDIFSFVNGNKKFLEYNFL